MEKLFFIPFYYTFSTRIDSFHKRLSWFIIYIIPVLFSFLFINNIDFNLSNISLSLLGILLIYNFYEIGYIANDTETIKKEFNPTIRLSLNHIDYYSKHKLSIYTYRIFLGFFISLIFFIFYKIYLFVFFSWSIILSYLIYNNIRNFWNLILHFFLVSLRFCLIPFLFLPYYNYIEIFIYMILLFPFLNTLERAKEKKFKLGNKIHFKINNCQDGRYNYYFFLIFLSLFIIIIKYFFNIKDIYSSIVFLFYSSYFFTYRYITYKLYSKYLM